jgi:hypothetical protein
MSDLSERLIVILTAIWWLQTLRRDRLAVRKRAAQKIHTKRFNLKKLNEREVNSSRLQSQTSLQLCETWKIVEASIGYKTLSQRKRETVIVDRSITNHGLMRNVHNWLIEVSRLNYSG